MDFTLRLGFRRPVNVFTLTLAALALLTANTSSHASAATPVASDAQPAHHIVRGFEEPLVATGPTTTAEDSALHRAIDEFEGPPPAAADIATRAQPFVDFLSRYPASPWRLSVLTNLGIGYYHDGYFSKAFVAWREAWLAGKNLSAPAAKALTDRAVGELARMHARVGHASELEQLFAELGDRQVEGPATELIAGAREGLWMFRHDPGLSYLCGPMALKQLLRSLGATPARINAMNAERSGPKGYTLSQLAKLATRSGVSHTLIFRKSGEPIPVPSIVNWKINHYAAIVEKRNGWYRIQDPTFASSDLWVTRRAIDTESSGYFLVPVQAGPIVWQQANASETDRIYGMGFTSVNEPGATKPNDKSLHCEGSVGMCKVNAKLSVLSLSLNDTPVGYAPARGPEVKVHLTYNQREASQPAVFSFFNIGPKWNLNFLSWIQDNPASPGASVTRFVAGGGFINYSSPYTYNAGTGEFSPERQGQAVLVRIPATGAITSYELRMPDGSKQVFEKLDGSTASPRRVFMTRIVDPAGNALVLNYDNQLRVTSLTDATGRNTIFSYGNTTNPLLITKITDPFGRYATLSYDSNGRLSSITDAIGLQSSFTYDAAGLINSMTTPYGTSTFIYGQNTTENSRYLEITDPLGLTERLEFRHSATGIPSSDPVAPAVPGLNNIYLQYRNTFHWDKHAYPITGRNFSQARISHWLHSPSNQTSPILESTKNPLERRVWLQYPGQTNSYYESSAAGTPTTSSRVLDDGTTQVSSFTYNSLGLPLTFTDPVGRRTTYTYAANKTDLTTVQQKTTSAGGNTQIAAFTYNSQHQPLTYTGAGLQGASTTTYAYNSAGQLTQQTDPLNRTTSFTYDALGRLISITNANGATQELRTYGIADLIATRTDSEGYVTSYSYDNLDRLTRELHPDGTTIEYTYNRLDLVAVKDRLNHTTSYSYDSNRRLIRTTDPLGRITSYAHYGNGALRSITDPNGNITSWDIDIQGRPTVKRFADGTIETYTYESSTSRLKTRKDALNQARNYTYFKDDRLSGINYTGAVNATLNVSFTDDAFFPRRTSMSDGLGTTTWSYHATGFLGALQLAVETGPYANNNSIKYTYDAAGQPVLRTVDSDLQTFSIDNLGRVISNTSSLGNFNSTYLGQTNLIAGRSNSNGSINTKFNYHLSRRLIDIKNSGGARSFNFVGFGDNLFTGINESTTGSITKTWPYSYDGSLRLLSAMPTSGPIWAYERDNADNITSFITGTTTKNATYNNVNQLTNLAGTTYTYDAVGNLTSDGVRTYKWDAENRLVAIAYPDPSAYSTVMRYDGLGRRLAIVNKSPTSGTREVRYLWCGDSICQARDATDTVIRRYFPYGEVRIQSGSTQRLYYAQDQLGSVRDVLDASTGQLLASQDFSPYGQLISQTGSITPDFGYAGMLNHDLTPLKLTNFRLYDPNSSRWLSRDPIAEAGGLNLYSYVEGNPVSGIDPYGLWSVTVGAFPGVGAQFTFGQNPNGSGFMSAQFGWGIGGGLSYNPLGKQPGYNDCQGASWGIGAGVYSQASFRAGPVGASVGANLGRNLRSGDSEIYRSFQASSSLKDQISGIKASASAGGQINVFGGGTAQKGCTCGQ